MSFQKLFPNRTQIRDIQIIKLTLPNWATWAVVGPKRFERMTSARIAPAASSSIALRSCTTIFCGLNSCPRSPAMMGLFYVQRPDLQIAANFAALLAWSWPLPGSPSPLAPGACLAPGGLFLPGPGSRRADF